MRVLEQQEAARAKSAPTGDVTNSDPPKRRSRLAPFWRAVIEIGFIMFLFYSNLLMGEFTRSNSAHGKSLLFAIGDIFTLVNFDIGIVAALIGYVVVEYLRAKF
jgi:hypothetical protein